MIVVGFLRKPYGMYVSYKLSFLLMLPDTIFFRIYGRSLSEALGFQFIFVFFYFVVSALYHSFLASNYIDLHFSRFVSFIQAEKDIESITLSLLGLQLE